MPACKRTRLGSQNGRNTLLSTNTTMRMHHSTGQTSMILPGLVGPPLAIGLTLDVTVVDSTEVFGKLRSEWQGLLEKSRSDCIFLTWEWLFTWWKWYGHNGKLLILLLRDEAGILRGLAPLMIRSAYGAFRKVLLVGSESKVCSEFLDIIAEKGWERDVASTVVRYLLKSRSHWDVCFLSSIRDDSPFLTALQLLPEARRFRAIRKTGYEAPYIALPSSWDKFLASLGSKTRLNVRVKRRKLEKAFHVEFVPWSELFDRRQAIEVMRTLQKKSISRKGIPGVFEDEKFSGFHSDIVDILHEKGWLSVVFLLCDGRPVAFWYAYLYGGTCYAYQTGFDLDYSSYSVGGVVHTFVLEDSIGRGIHTFEYLRGGQQYKYHFTTTGRQMLEVSLFTDCWTSMLLQLLVTSGRRIRRRITELFGKDLRQRLRAWIDGL